MVLATKDVTLEQVMGGFAPPGEQGTLQMIQPEEPEQKRSFLDRLPRVGRLSQFVLLVGIFLILFVMLSMIYLQQPARQAELERELSLLETILAVPMTQKEELEAEISQIEAETQVAREQFPAPAQAAEIVDTLLGLAEDNDIDVTVTQQARYQWTIGEVEDAIVWPVTTFVVDLKGQVPKFQNFILALDDRLPACQVREVYMLVACVEGEEDTGTVIIDVFHYEGSEEP